MLEIREVSTRKDRKAFLTFPLELYKNCPWFVPPLYMDEKKLLRSHQNNPDADSVFYLAWEKGRVVGRIQGIIQKRYNQIHNTAKMRFTRFDCLDDQRIADALFNAIQQWGAQRGMQELCGPLGYSDLDREGLLVEGFQEDTTFEEQYNYEYYGKLIEGVGFCKDVDWVEYELRLPQKRNEMLSRVAMRSLELNKLHIAPSNMSKRKYIKKYQDSFFDCLDECYRHLYGTVPLTREAQQEMVDQFVRIVNKEYINFVCDEQDRVVAFGLCFPGIGKAIQKSGGRLTPATLLRLRKTVRNPEIIDLGLVAVRPEYQKSGLNAVVLNGLLDILENGHVCKCETNLNLETNTAVQAQWKYFDARQHKRRRSYIKQIGE